MRAADVLRWWEAHLPRTPLAAHVARAQHPARWLRVHSLPGGKRYADTAAERAEVLHRATAVLAATVGDGGEAVVIWPTFPEEPPPPPAIAAALAALAPAPLTMSDDPMHVAPVPVLFARLAWTPGSLDAVLTAVADDVLATPLVLALAAGHVVAPYDGGVDVIARDATERHALAARFAAWLPPPPSMRP